MPAEARRPMIASALLALLVYALTLSGTYIYDDLYVASADPRLKEPGRWTEYFTKAYMPGAADRLWRPLTSLSFAAQWHLHGDRPWAMHLVNVLLHAATSAAVTLLAFRFAQAMPPRSSRPRLTAYVAGLLFAVHPVHVEDVAYLVGRADSLMTLFTVIAIVLFLSPMTHPRAVAITACMLGAVFSKEPGMLIPGFLLACLPARRALPGPPAPDAPPRPSSLSPMRTLLLLVCWTLAGYIVFREHYEPAGSKVFKLSWDPSFLDATINPLAAAATPTDRLLLPFEILGHYLRLLVFPLHLTLDYGGITGNAVRWNEPYVYLGFATVVAWWVTLIVAWRRKVWPVVSALICLAISYSIISNVGILIGTNIGERLMYLPSVFFLTLVALILPSVFSSPVLYLLTSILVLSFSLRTATYARLWNDPKTLYETLANRQPASMRLWMLLTDVLLRSNRPAEAAVAAARGRDADPTYWRIWYYSADAEIKLGHYEKALEYIDVAWNMKITNFPMLRDKRDEANAALESATRPAATQSAP